MLEQEENPRVSLKSVTEINPPSDYQSLEDYAEKKWARDTDKYRLAESIKTGPTNCGECVDKLIPNVDRSTQTKRFHAVKHQMNQELQKEFGFEVFRDNEQVVIRRLTKPTPSKKKVPKKSPKRKT